MPRPCLPRASPVPPLLLASQRLWFKTNLKLCKLWFDLGEYGRMAKVTR